MFAILSIAGAGPCHGDSGGGFFVKSGSAWYLQGIISSSLFDRDGKCDVTHFVVFTDVVKYSAWVDEITSQKFINRRFEYETVIDGKRYEAHSYQTYYYRLNGESEAASSISFKKI